MRSVKFWSLFLTLLATCIIPVHAQVQGTNGAGPGVGFYKNPTQVAPSDASYATVNSEGGTLPSSRRIQAAGGITLTDHGAGGDLTISTQNTLNYLNSLSISSQQTLADNVLNFPGKAAGDMWYYDGTHVSRLGIGSEGYLLTVSSGLPAWSNVSAPAPATAQYILGLANGTLSNGMVLTAGSGITYTPIVGSTATIAVDNTVIRTTGVQSLAGPKTLTGGPIIGGAQTNGLVLAGSSFNDTIKITDPAAARTLTIPDPGADASFVMTQGAQSISGVKTFSTNPVMTAIVPSGGGLLTLPTATDTLVGRATTDTLTNKTISNAILSGNVTLHGSTHDYTVSWSNPAAATAIVIPDPGSSANVMLDDQGTATAGGVVYGKGGHQYATTTAGGNGQPLLSNTSSAPTFGTLGLAGGGTNNSGLAATAGGVIITDGTKMVNVGAGSAGQVLQSNGGSNASWGSVIANGSIASGTIHQLPAYTGTGKDIGPSSTISEPTSAGSSGQFLKTDGAGIASWANTPPVLGGTGADGAISTFTVPIINATTISVSSTTGPTAWRNIRMNASSTASFASGTAIKADGTGYPGCALSGTTTTFVAGYGPAGGFSSASNVIGGGGGAGAGAVGGTANGGGGGNGGGASPILGGEGGIERAIAQTGIAIDAGSGGGNGGDTVAIARGGAGGGTITVCANGAITISSGGLLSANGAAGTNSTTNAKSGAGGGGGGAVLLYSATSITVAAGGVTVQGGAGGNGLTTGSGGGGGGGGIVIEYSPSNSNSLVTATACAKGAGGSTGSGTAGSTGTDGQVILITGTPNLPLLSQMENGGMAKVIKLARIYQDAGVVDKNGAVELTHRGVCRAITDNIIDFMRCMSDTMDTTCVIDVGDYNKDALANAA